MTGRKIRGLGEKDLYRVLRWTPMAVADLVAEWFETELLRGTIAAQGIFGTFLGPWSAGSSATLLLRAASDSNLAGPASYIVGGTGALTAAMAAAAIEAGAEIRTGCDVSAIKVKDGAAVGVALVDWRRDRLPTCYLQCRSQTHAAGPAGAAQSSTQLPAKAAALSNQRHGRKSQSCAWRRAAVQRRQWRHDSVAFRQNSDLSRNRLPGACL